MASEQVYLVMAVTILFNVLKGFSRFRLWRIDAAREKLETALKELVDPTLTHAQMRAVPAERVVAVPEKRAAAQAIMDRLVELRAPVASVTRVPLLPPWAMRCSIAISNP